MDTKDDPEITSENLPVSGAVRDLVLRRSDAYRRDPGAAVPLEEAPRRIEQTLGASAGLIGRRQSSRSFS